MKVSGKPEELGNVYNQPKPNQDHLGVSEVETPIAATGNKRRHREPITNNIVSGVAGELGETPVSEQKPRK